MLKTLVKRITPPFLLQALRKFRGQPPQKPMIVHHAGNPNEQDLDLYWDPEYVKVLDEWGRDNVWNEIQMILGAHTGKVLDIACGSGVTIKLLDKYKSLDVHGFDISDLLIGKALANGIPKSHLRVADATATSYAKDEFDFSYSIGSLEHFTVDGIEQFIAECARYTKLASFHMVPVSRKNEDEGWMKTLQSFYNNSESWWMEKFRKQFSTVHAIPSKWEDPISVGRWFICIK